MYADLSVASISMFAKRFERVQKRCAMRTDCLIDLDSASVNMASDVALVPSSLSNCGLQLYCGNSNSSSISNSNIDRGNCDAIVPASASLQRCE